MSSATDSYPTQSHSTFLGPTHTQQLFHMADINLTSSSRESTTLGTVPAPELASSRGIIWSLSALASQFNSSFAWFHFPHSPKLLISRAFPEKSPAWKSAIQNLLLGEHNGRQKPPSTPHKTRSDIRSRKFSAACHQNPNSKLLKHFDIYCLPWRIRSTGFRVSQFISSMASSETQMLLLPPFNGSEVLASSSSCYKIAAAVPVSHLYTTMPRSKRETISSRKQYDLPSIPSVSPHILIGQSWVTCPLLNKSLARKIRSTWGWGLCPVRDLATGEAWVPEGY